MKSILFIITLFVLSGCSKKEKPVEEKLDGNILRTLVSEAINGIYSANQQLSDLIDYSLPIDSDYNSLIIDSLKLNNKTFYYVLLEFPDPEYNRFAVYDSSFSPQLLDKSLNGNIYQEKIKVGNKDFIKIDEVYLSKDTLLLNRLSLYQVDTSGAYLAFRTHTKFSKPDIVYFQNITEISDSLIKTIISIMNREDRFVFDPSEKKYISSQNIFDEFINNEIKSFDYEPVKQQLIDTNTSN
jgi:hypothetical protein